MFATGGTSLFYLVNMALRTLTPRLARLSLSRSLQTAALGAKSRVPDFAFAFE